MDTMHSLLAYAVDKSSTSTACSQYLPLTEFAFLLVQSLIPYGQRTSLGKMFLWGHTHTTACGSLQMKSL